MPRKVCPAAIAIIKVAESCRLRAYPDPGSGGDPWTIGYGATRDRFGKEIHPGEQIMQSEADWLFARDLAEFAGIVEGKLGTADTTANQFGAMVSLAYNIGIGNFRESSVLRFHLAGDHHDAAEAFGAWDKADGHVLPGLVARRAAESRLYLTPDGASDAERP